jgi:hypothetical protein
MIVFLPSQGRQAIGTEGVISRSRSGWYELTAAALPSTVWCRLNWLKVLDDGAPTPSDAASAGVPPCRAAIPLSLSSLLILYSSCVMDPGAG